MQTESARLGELLREKLKIRGMTSSQFADAAGIARSTVSSILSGNRVPGPKNWAQIQSALQLSPAEAAGLWESASTESKRLTALREISVSLAPINLDHPGVSKLVIDYFGEALVAIRRQGIVTQTLEMTGTGAGGGTITYLREDLQADREQAQGYDLVIICRSGAQIAVAVRGFAILAARFRDVHDLPSCDPVQIVRSGGVVFQMRPITNVKHLE